MNTSTLTYFSLLLIAIFKVIQTKHHQRIIPGNLANITDYPWSAYIRLMNSTWGEAPGNCQGSIIGDEWVLTALHCVIGSMPDEVRIRVGDSNWKKGKEYKADNIYMKGTSNDPYMGLGLIKIKGKFKFGPTLKKIKLFENETFDKSFLEVASWGKSTGNGESWILRQYYWLNTFHWKDAYRQLVISYPESAKNIIGGSTVLTTFNDNIPLTFGDAGAAIVTAIRKVYYVVAVLYFPPEPVDDNLFPTIHVKIYLWINWIKNKTKTGA